MPRLASTVALVAASLVLARDARAEHGDPWLTVSPNVGEVLPPNARITLFSDNGLHATFTELPRLAPRLSSGADVVPLKVGPVLEGTDGGYGSHARVLTPTRPLRPATRYRLEVRGAGGTGPHAAVWVIHDWAKGTDATWATSRAGDATAPRWTAAPTLGRDAHGQPSIRAAVTDDGPVLVRVDARPVKGGRAYGLLVYFHGVFGVDGGCSGFRWYRQPGGPLTVRLTAVDRTGREVAAPGAALTVPSADFVSVCVTP